MAGETRYTPRLLLSLCERFPEGSEYDAELMGSRELRDWTLANILRAANVNAVNSNTIITGNWKKGHVPQIEPIGPPKVDKPVVVNDEPENEELKLIALMGHFMPRM